MEIVFGTRADSKLSKLAVCEIIPEYQKGQIRKDDNVITNLNNRSAPAIGFESMLKQKVRLNVYTMLLVWHSSL